MSFKLHDKFMFLGTEGVVVQILEDNRFIAEFPSLGASAYFNQDGNVLNFSGDLHRFTYPPKAERSHGNGDSKYMHFRVSITGILSRFFETGMTKKDLKVYQYPIEEFIKNFELAKSGVDKGNLAIAKEFFDLYT
jgi:hypothetical protein